MPRKVVKASTRKLPPRKSEAVKMAGKYARKPVRRVVNPRVADTSSLFPESLDDPRATAAATSDASSAFMGVFIGDPREGGVEVQDGLYRRVPVTKGEESCIAFMSSPKCTRLRVSHWGAYTEATGGRLLASGAIVLKGGPAFFGGGVPLTLKVDFKSVPAPQPENEAQRRDMVNHPPHYTAHPSGVECIQITEHMNFNIGNTVKYLWRAGDKGELLEDLRKAAWYLNREIERVSKTNS